MIPPMPKFPVAPTTSDPVAYAEYKRQYADYSAWYEKVSIVTTSPPGPASYDRTSKCPRLSIYGSIKLHIVHILNWVLVILSIVN